MITNKFRDIIELSEDIQHLKKEVTALVNPVTQMRIHATQSTEIATVVSRRRRWNR